MDEREAPQGEDLREEVSLLAGRMRAATTMLGGAPREHPVHPGFRRRWRPSRPAPGVPGESGGVHQRTGRRGEKEMTAHQQHQGGSDEDETSKAVTWGAGTGL